MVFLLQQTWPVMVPLMLVALAGIYAERSGIINIALEGIMVMGSFACAFFMRKFQEYGVLEDSPQLSVILGMVLSALVGAVFAMLLAYAAIRWKADQTISGTALNMIAPAVILFLSVALFMQEKIVLLKDPGTVYMIKATKETRQATDFFSKLYCIFFDKAYITTYIGVAIFIVMSIILYKTKFGLRLRSCGEHPQAADSVGINVHKMRYIGVAISGALGGMGGFIYSLSVANGATTGSVSGFGFLAMAIMIFGNWKPLNVAIVSFFFAILRVLGSAYGSIDINGDGVYALAELSKKVPLFSSSFYSILPYFFTLVVLALTSKSTRAPKAEGIPYDKGQR